MKRKSKNPPQKLKTPSDLILETLSQLKNARLPILFNTLETLFATQKALPKTKRMNDLARNLFAIEIEEETKEDDSKFINLLLSWKIKYVEDLELYKPKIVTFINWCLLVADANVYIRESTIKNAGYGLFTRKEIQEDEVITMYGGLEMSENIYDYEPALKDKDGYILQVSEHKFIDGRLCFGVLEAGRWANTKFEEGEGEELSAYFGPDASVRAVKKISPRSEIFLVYGAKYKK
jgi:hypothetical protein